MKKAFTYAAAMLLASTTMAAAATFSLDLSGLDGVDGTADDAIFTTIPGGIEANQAQTASNAVLDELGPMIPNAYQDAGNNNFWTLDGYQGAQILFSGAGKVRVEIFGWEAGFENTVTVAGSPDIGKSLGDPQEVVAADLNSPLATFGTATLGAGLLDLSFISTNNGPLGNKGGVTNGVNPIIGQNFFVSCHGDSSATTCKNLWVFYDDSLVAGDNHDDLVIKISAVPLPAGAVLMLTGIGALALRRRMTA